MLFSPIHIVCIVKLQLLYSYIYLYICMKKCKTCTCACSMYVQGLSWGTLVFWHYTCVNFDTVLKLFFYSSAYDWVSSICVHLSNSNKLQNLTVVCSPLMTEAMRCLGLHAVCFEGAVWSVSCLVEKLAACYAFLFTFSPGVLKNPR